MKKDMRLFHCNELGHNLDRGPSSAFAELEGEKSLIDLLSVLAPIYSEKPEEIHTSGQMHSCSTQSAFVK